jgi:hypothetical protein
LAYSLNLAARQIIVALNLSGSQQSYTIRGIGSGRVLLSTQLGHGDEVNSRITLSSNEGLIITPS